MPFEKGSLILAEYTAKTKEDDQVIEATAEADAKEHSLYDPERRYRPKLVSISEMNFPVPGKLNDALAAAAEGDRLTVEIELAFGARDKNKVRMIPLRKLGDDAERVSPGDAVEIGGRRGVVRFMGSGRVQVDYNHKHAGKTLVYDITITKSLGTDDERIAEILRRRLDADESGVQYERSGGVLSVTIPQDLFRAEGLHRIKSLAQSDLFKFIPGIEEIRLVETHHRQGPAPGAEQPAAEAPAAPGPEKSA